MSNNTVHLFPFGIDREGPINTKDYFSVNKTNDQYETVMLGRKLVGTSVSLKNDSTQGHIWEKKVENRFDDMEEEEEEEEIRETWIKTSTTIDNFLLWKKDTQPNKDDPRINAVQHWLDISQIINEPIPLPPTTN